MLNTPFTRALRNSTFIPLADLADFPIYVRREKEEVSEKAVTATPVVATDTDARAAEIEAVNTSPMEDGAGMSLTYPQKGRPYITLTLKDARVLDLLGFMKEGASGATVAVDLAVIDQRTVMTLWIDPDGMHTVRFNKSAAKVSMSVRITLNPEQVTPVLGLLYASQHCYPAYRIIKETETVRALQLILPENI